MNSHLVPKFVGSGVANLRNSALLRAICALNPTNLNRNLLRPELIRDSLSVCAFLAQFQNHNNIAEFPRRAESRDFDKNLSPVDY